MSDPEKRKKGIALFKRITEGQPRNPSSSRSSVPADFSRYSMEHLFGDVWQGEDLDFQARSMITCTVLVSLNREAELRIHFPGARNLGIERVKIEAMITHVAHYAGWPAAASAFRGLGEVWPKEEEKS